MHRCLYSFVLVALLTCLSGCESQNRTRETRHAELALELALGVQPTESGTPLYEPIVLETIFPQASPPPQIVREPQDTQRFSIVEMRWKGGDPGVDRPRVLLQKRNTAGEFETVRKANGLPLDDAGPEIALLYQDAHEWSAYWDVPREVPTGTYRFLVEGGIYTGGGPDPHPPYYPSSPYGLASRPFTVAAAGPFPVGSAVWTPGRFAARLAYPPVDHDLDPNTPDGLRWRPSCPVRVDGTLSFYDSAAPEGDPVHKEDHTFLLEANCRLQAVIDATFTPENHILEVSLQDPFGNPFQTLLP